MPSKPCSSSSSTTPATIAFTLLPPSGPHPADGPPSAIQTAIITHLATPTCAIYIPVLEATPWGLIHHSRAARDALETLGDAVLYELALELLLAIFPFADARILDLIMQGLSSNLTLLHLLHNVGVYDTLEIFNKGVGNAFEIVLGAMFESVGWTAVKSWMDDLLPPLLHAAWDGHALHATDIKGLQASRRLDENDTDRRPQPRRRGGSTNNRVFNGRDLRNFLFTLETRLPTRLAAPYAP
ncbi:hypothetical protein C8R44DRAFT_910270 [Mycena epipterygia]|nr:hypothetical protein C8R44DRAFT_910270 [Mycena epipterygia]